jgi:hypothetical protein
VNPWFCTSFSCKLLYITDSGFYRFHISQTGEISEIGYFETEKLVMEEVNKEFEVSLNEWETLNTI